MFWIKVIAVNLVWLALAEVCLVQFKDFFDKSIYGPVPRGEIVDDFRRIIQPSNNPGKVVELKRDLSVIFKGQPFETNKYGFRGSDWAVDKAPGIKRIIGIGDSVMMGWGVGQDQTYLELLTKKLNAREGQKYESLNLGVGGYNCSQEYETLVNPGMKFKPDLLILQYVGNDSDKIETVYHDSPRAAGIHLVSLLSFFMNKLMHNSVVSWQPYEAPSGVPTKQFVSCLSEFGKFSRANAIPVIYILDSRYIGHIAHSSVERVAKREGFYTLNLFAKLRALPESVSIEEAVTVKDRHNLEYIIDLQNERHPNSKWHELVSELVLDIILRI